ncbi:MAG: hypothetical protein AAGI52_09585 [Bacteroidota bacterium]
MSPTVLIGLGTPGVDLAEAVAEAVLAEAPDLAPVFAHLALRRDGLTVVPPSEVEPIDRLDLDMADEPTNGVWSANDEILREREDELRGTLESAIRSVRAFGAAADSNTVDLYLTTSLNDPVGSVAMRWVLEALHEAFDVRLLGLSPRIHLLLLGPSLSASSPSTLAYGRVFAAWQELEWLFERAESEKRQYAQKAWLLTGATENGQFVADWKATIPPVAYLVKSSMTGEGMTDGSYSVALHAKAYGRRRRYATLGYARMVYPREELVRAATQAALHEALKDLPVFEPNLVPAATVSSTAEQFIRDQKIDRLDDLLGEGTDGARIWRDVAPSGVAGVGAGKERHLRGEKILEALDEYVQQYEDTEPIRMVGALGERRQQLEGAQRDALLGQVNARLNQPEPGGGAAALAWLAALEGKPSEHIDGETVRHSLTLRAVDDRLREFFDRQFEDTLLQGGSEEVQAAARDLEEKGSSHRTLLRRVDKALDVKSRRLEVLLSQKQQQRAELAEGNPDDADAAKGEAEASAPSRSINETTRDAIVRQAHTRSVLSRQRENTEQTLVKAEASVEELKAEMVFLERVQSELKQNVDVLDAAIDDASKRETLAKEAEQNALQQVTTSREAYGRAVRSVRDKQSAFHDVEATRNREAGWAALYGIGMLALAAAGGYVHMQFGTASWIPWLWAGVGVLAALIFSGWTFRKRFLLPLRGANGALHAAQVSAESRYSHLVGRINHRHHEPFRHYLYGELVDWRNRLGGVVADTRKKLESFPEAVQKRAAEAAKKSIFTPHPDPHILSLVSEESVRVFVEERSEDLARRCREYWRHNPPSSLFHAATSGADARALDGAVAGLEQALREAFQDLETETIEDHFARVLEEDEARFQFARGLYERAAPFAARGHDHLGLRPPATFATIGADEGGVLQETLRPMGQKGLYFSGLRSQTEVPVLRFSIGGAAYEFALATTARHSFYDLTAEQQAGVYLGDVWRKKRVTDLTPSELELGDAEDHVRIHAVLAAGYGIAPMDPEGRVTHGPRTFPDLRRWILHLRRVDGSETLEEVVDLIAEKRRRYGEAENRALSHFAKRHLDPVDQEIVSAELLRNSSTIV